ncbi:MAG: hypothetical protein J5505_08245 [Spirochaetaceae bacterium]|nr:hypothetical protein [Spirochaetaceae bacterium]
MKILKLCIFAMLAAVCSASAFAAQTMSSFTMQKYRDFTECRVQASKTIDCNAIIESFSKFEEEVLAGLPDQAVDLEQEKLFWESCVRLAKFEYIFNIKSDIKQERLLMKDQMERNENYISAHKKTDGVNPLFYMITADTTSCYMSFSVASAMFHGMRVKTLYETAASGGADMWAANLGLAQWMFYAPGFLGGGNKKAEKHFLAAIEASQTDAEKFYTYIYYAQFLFESGRKEECSAFMQKADTLYPSTNYIAQIKKLNNCGTGLFTYNRNHSGVDQNTDPDAKDL